MKLTFRNRIKPLMIGILALLLGVVPVLAVTSKVLAVGELSNRSIKVDSSDPSANTSHRFRFNINSLANIGSIQFLYCDNSPLQNDVCSPPAGLNLSGASLSNQSGENGFVINNVLSNANKLIITRAPTFAVAGPVAYDFSGLINPSGPSQSFYVRISTYSSIDASTGLNDFGSTVFSTSGGLGARGFVPPFLTFCVGITVAQDCSATSGDFINFGELSSSSTRSATLQFAGATNVDIGYAISFSGTSLTSGNNVVLSPSVPTLNKVGTAQFGFNLRANNNPSVGLNPLGGGTAVPTSNYNSPDKFMLVDGDVIASSPLTTDFNLFTASYIVNVSKSQPAGVYSTTNTFIATAQF